MHRLYDCDQSPGQAARHALEIDAAVGAAASHSAGEAHAAREAEIDQRVQAALATALASARAEERAAAAIQGASRRRAWRRREGCMRASLAKAVRSERARVGALRQMHDAAAAAHAAAEDALAATLREVEFDAADSEHRARAAQRAAAYTTAIAERASAVSSVDSAAALAVMRRALGEAEEAVDGERAHGQVIAGVAGFGTPMSSPARHPPGRSSRHMTPPLT